MDNRFDGFAVNLYLDDEESWLAHFVELPEVSAFGDSPEVALAELASAWDAVRQRISMKAFQYQWLQPVKATQAHSTFVSIEACIERLRLKQPVKVFRSMPLSPKNFLKPLALYDRFKTCKLLILKRSLVGNTIFLGISKVILSKYSKSHQVGQGGLPLLLVSAQNAY